jgi:hypothetical protein
MVIVTGVLYGPAAVSTSGIPVPGLNPAGMITFI